MCGGGGGGGGSVSRSTPVSIPRPTPVVEQPVPKIPVVTPLFTDGIDKPKEKVKPPVVEQKKNDDLKKYLDGLLTSVTDLFKKDDPVETPVVPKPRTPPPVVAKPPVVTAPPMVAKPPVVVAPPVVTRPITPTPPVAMQPPVVSTPPPALPPEPKKPIFDYSAV